MTLLRPLTPRQLDVAKLVASGLGTTEVAKRLSISYEAAKMHVNAIADLVDERTTLTPLRTVMLWASKQEW